MSGDKTMLLLQLLAPDAASKLASLSEDQCRILRNAVQLYLITSDPIDRVGLKAAADDTYTDLNPGGLGTP
jgi:hypothetical protein